MHLCDVCRTSQTVQTRIATATADTTRSPAGPLSQQPPAASSYLQLKSHPATHRATAPTLCRLSANLKTRSKKSRSPARLQKLPRMAAWRRGRKNRSKN